MESFLIIWKHKKQIIKWLEEESGSDVNFVVVTVGI